jgi:hypothetical protein
LRLLSGVVAIDSRGPLRDAVKKNFSSLLQVVANISGQGFEPDVYIVMARAIPRLLFVYGEELADFWPLYLSVLDRMIDSGYYQATHETLVTFFLKINFVNRSEDRINDLEKRMMTLGQMLMQTNALDQHLNLIMHFNSYAYMISHVQPSTVAVLRWAIERIQIIGKMEKSYVDSTLRSFKHFVKIALGKIDVHETEWVRNFAIAAINDQSHWRIRSFGLRLLWFDEKRCASLPIAMIQRVIQILLSECAECAMEALKFLIVLSTTQTAEFFTFGEILFNFCSDKLKAIEGPSRNSDLFIANLVQFPLSSEFIPVYISLGIDTIETDA